jgi:uncharacterized protein YdeI (YjbR/CyaY-like superfamily)
MNKRVDVALRKEARWPEEMAELRKIALASGLTEELKWGQPCYTLNGKNVFLLHGFKEYFAILFLKAAIMKDPDKLLIQQTANVQSGRQMRFKNMAELKKLKPVVKKYIAEAIAVEESGAKVPVKKAADFEIPDEVLKAMKKISGLTPAFKKLTPGRQRGYVLHFMGAKQEVTRVSRIEKAALKIFEGKGLTD